jgi:isoleucyl-tRNA synthetase
MTTRYPEVAPTPDFPKLEHEILAFWKNDQTFQASVSLRPAGPGGGNEYVFYDGPPFANGLPHYGHLLTGYVKDIIPRYQTMRGRRVDRRFGWDCHGLPAEMEAERQLGISGREAIEAFGIDRFNDYCKKSVLRYTDEWEAYVTRQARWVDFENDYKTMDLSYMESVMWAFRQLWDKKLIYEGYRVMPYSWAAETPLSNFEIRMDNAYRMRQDPAITVRFRLDPRPGDPGPLSVLVWTTTPWTLPANLALAVGEDIDYGVYRLGDEMVVIGEAVVAGSYQRDLQGAERVARFRGRDLVGRTYSPLFPYFRNNPGSFRVLAGDFVDTEEGTGTVHLAPGFGEDDQRVCDAHQIPLVVPVDDKGRFTAEVPDWEGMNVFDANKPIIQALKDRGVLFRQAVYEHNYPHCWRTDQPLIYKAVNSWYVEVTRIRERMSELNQEIRWIPERVRDGQFGKWLENARDWSISRNRFWGSPIPVWRSDDPRYPRIDVYGSLDEIERDFGVRPDDLHRPFVDLLTRPNPDDPSGRSTMRRVGEVLDCWFESGSMPYAQVHYPFENKEWFESHFPADFIVEYVGQTRGWFYTLVVLSTALFDRPPFRNCMCHGVVLDEDAQKLSKKLRNYPDPIEMCETYGSDALRWFLVSSPILRGGDLQIDREGAGIKDVMRLVLNPLYNAYYFFTLYANSDGITACYRTTSRHVLDRYILARTRRLIEQVTESMDAYDVAGACQEVSSFLDAMNNWHIRRSRPRFWREGTDADKQDAYDTLYAVLLRVARVTAPLMPLLTEVIYRGLSGERSVHLADWPDPGELPSDPDLVDRMDRGREVCSAALSIRDAHKLRTRLPLRTLTIAGDQVEGLRPYLDLIRDEVNVKEVVLTDDREKFGTFELHLNSRVAGKRLGPEMKAVLASSRAGDWTLLEGGAALVGSVRLSPEEFSLRLRTRNGVAGQALPGNDALVVLDTTVTPELETEGLARDLVRFVQQTRKEANLHVADHIRLSIGAEPSTEEALRSFAPYISEQTLANELRFGGAGPGDHAAETLLNGHRVVIGLARAR